MRIVAARVTPVRLPLHHPVGTSHGEITTRDGAVLELEDDGLRAASAVVAVRHGQQRAARAEDEEHRVSLGSVYSYVLAAPPRERVTAAGPSATAARAPTVS